MQDEFDPFLRWGPICAALGGISRRTLYSKVQNQDFPAPDRPAQRRGEADLWRKSTVKRALEAYATGSATRRETPTAGRADEVASSPPARARRRQRSAPGPTA
jgi:predicted DNA-binding transcriptional regulator AlpA